MATKRSSKKSGNSEIRESAHRIWLAGLGAVAAAEEGGGKLFKSLVSRGSDYETRISSELKKVGGTIQETATDARDRADSTASKLRDRAESAWDGLENAFDDRVDSALHRIGVPSKREIARLSRKVDELTRALAAKGSASSAQKTAGAKKKVAKKKVAKKKAAKREVSKKASTRKTPAKSPSRTKAAEKASARKRS